MSSRAPELGAESAVEDSTKATPDVVESGGSVELGLRPKPAPDPAILAVLAVAADALWPRPAGQDDERGQPQLAWRFSGRWWNKPSVLRRDRPRTMER